MPTAQPFLFKRPNGFWYIHYLLNGRHKWKSTGCTNKFDATIKLREFQISPSESLPQKSLSVFAKEFLEFARPTYAHSSYVIFEICLRNLQDVTGDCPLERISQRHVDSYKASRIDRVSPRTVNDELRSLRTIFYYALRWDIIASNPFAKFQQVRVPEMPPLFFTKTEFQTLLSAVKDQWFREVIVLAVLTGMRRAEIANLKWSDVDLERRLIHIHSTQTFRSKWGKQRVIPLNNQVVESLRTRVSQNPDTYVFTLKGQKVKEETLTQKFKKLVKASGVTKGLHFHSLRHTHATWLVQDGVSIYEVQKLLGHTSIEMTQIYSHLQPEHLHATVNRLRLEMTNDSNGKRE